MIDVDEFEFMDDLDKLYADWVEWTGAPSEGGK